MVISSETSRAYVVGAPLSRREVTILGVWRVVPVHEPAWQESPPVQALASSQAVPFGFAVLALHWPVAGAHGGAALEPLTRRRWGVH